MPIRIIKLFILIAVIAVAIYFVSLNSSTATVTVGGGNTVTASTGSIVLTSFALGILLAFLTASLFAVKSFFREQGFKNREKKRVELLHTTLQIRESERTENSASVEKRYQSLIKKFPREVLPHLEYIRFLLHRDNRPNEALKALIECRGTFDSTELLYLTAEAHEKLGNVSSALETLSMIIDRERAAAGSAVVPLPTIRKAANLSFSLNRYEDAIEFLDLIKEYDSFSEADTHLNVNCLSSIIIRDESDEEVRLKKLFELLRKQDCSTVGLAEIARLQEKYHLHAEAAESLIRLFRLNGNVDSVRAARTMWIQQGNGSAALAAIKQWLRAAASENEKITAEIELAKTYLLLSQDDDALKTLEQLKASPVLSLDHKKEISILTAMIMYRKKDAHGAQGAFAEVENLTLADVRITPRLVSSF